MTTKHPAVGDRFDSTLTPLGFTVVAIDDDVIVVEIDRYWRDADKRKIIVQRKRAVPKGLFSTFSKAYKYKKQ